MLLHLSYSSCYQEVNKYHCKKLDTVFFSCLCSLRELSLAGIVPRPGGGEAEQHCGALRDKTGLPKKFWGQSGTPRPARHLTPAWLKVPGTGETSPLPATMVRWPGEPQQASGQQQIQRALGGHNAWASAAWIQLGKR